MDIDFGSLAARIAADIQDVRGCVVVSRDGLVLGSHPTDAEDMLRPTWLRFASLGDVERGFIQFSTELWVYVRRGPYAVFAVSVASSRPGLLLDEMEQVLLATEEARESDQAASPSGGGLPGSRPRTSLHPDPKPADVDFAELPATRSEEVTEVAAEDTTVVIDERLTAPAEERPLVMEDSGDVDRVSLAQEFAQLLGDSGYDDSEED
jgi:hypothetical protein